MRAGRLEEILYGNERIVVCGANKPIEKKFITEWLVMDFARKFPNTEIIKLTTIKGELHLFVYDATAQALLEKRYEDVIKYSEELECHIFDSDTEYINQLRKRLEEGCPDGAKKQEIL